MRKVVVTGGNRGIGRAIVQAILDRHEDTFVFMGSREEARGQARPLAKELLQRLARVGLDEPKRTGGAVEWHVQVLRDGV